MRTILLLFASNCFMTVAWYWHLNHKEMPLWKAILISWGIAFFEYCLTVPANRIGSIGGTATINNNRIDYAPSRAFSGLDTFTYTISDGHGHTATANVSVDVLPIPRPR
jgi:hypothetical protein